ncbi:uncharacterized protein LOC133530805 [Cydia pomonella]|uniref:uncharacterized protein LOC133530404 n=1 Tax=Cydia pomonella TaxID=82600 RepID=UPI002ADDF692|nr:uncharacterized protein LOC133530404 [Cydia pomonella]XP_061724854.1 uncharacterized protein LOC133530805 [Cydia pomonella]
MECINSLNNLNVNTDSWDPIIIFLVGQKLDAESVKDWEQTVHKDSSEDMPKWEELQKFLVAKFRTLEMAAAVSMPTRDKSQTPKTFHVAEQEEDEESLFQCAHASVASQPTCTYCKGEHYIFNCKEFTKNSVEDRHDFVRKNRLCYNCLVPYHNVFRCKQKTSCRICRKRHHSLLHQTREANEEVAATQPQSQPEPDTKLTTLHVSKQQPSRKMLLATAQVAVRSSDGDTHILRALIDPCSEASFVSERVVQLLGLPRTSINGVVSGLEESTQINIKHMVDITISSRYENKKTVLVSAYVLKSVSTYLPSKHISIDSQAIETLKLADPTYDIPSKVDMLLGAEIYCQIIQEGLLKMNDGIVAQKTTLGWILTGRKQIEAQSDQHNVTTLHITRMVAEDNDLLRRFWEIETDVYKKKKILTKEEEKCEEIYKRTTKRDESGRYTVHLPLKQNVEETVNLCGDTKHQAINRFQSLERKFRKDDKLKQEYTNVINEYKDMGHLRRSETQNDENALYLAHLAVIREDKDTSKVRVVYDASAKGSHGHSLNDTMMVGPVLQPDLRSLVIAWRKHKICVVGDIVKMYRMINMTKEHINLQRIVWRDRPEDEFESYELTTVTFGTAAAPFLAVRTLNQLADDEAHEFPETAPVIKKSFYMDDLMVGNENIEETKKMCQEIKEILRRGGFRMQKWSSNSDEVLEYLKEDNSTRDTLEIKMDKIIKILGLTWNRQDDTFEITVNLPEMRSPITKRSILSDVARLFDPFGWLAPVIITAKVLIQKLWLSHLGWDDELTSDLTDEWIRYREELVNLQNIKVQRWLHLTREDDLIELHGFSDASTQAYAAVTYLKVVRGGVVYVSMIASRTKVAPLKQLSVPKLELCAAALLAELISDVAELLKIPKNKIFVWTDSMVVLAWLQSQPSRWKTFVANRTADITRLIDNDRWRHVQSADNPADIATRGVKAQELATQDLWWNGPDWLKRDQVEYEKTEIAQTELESKTTCHVLVDERPIWERFSTMSRMKRVLAYCRRMLTERKRELEESKHLTVKEMEKVEEECIRFYQNLVYRKDIDDLKKDGRVKKRSTLITLAPFLDEKELKCMFEPGKNNLASEVAELLATEGTTWHFIPPRMPSYGGLWEAGVQSAKRHLARVNKDTKLTYEELATLLTQVEACLNSRPLCEIDSTTGVPLTPGHFLVGEPLVSVPDFNYEHKKVNILTRWQLVQKMTQNFWRQWQNDYLNTLQQRYKWQVTVPAPCIGDLVIIKDEITPPTKWLLGRVKYLHPGADNLVRVVTVQCKGDHELKRPLSKLILLPKTLNE